MLVHRPFGSAGILVLLAALVLASPAAAIDLDDTRLLSDPAISATHVAFVYAGDVWVVDRDGGRARRLTSHLGEETNPRFSPDGRTIAFSAEYDGNIDVYTVPLAGGEPSRLTWHPAADRVQGFMPDGATVLFASAREVYTRRYEQLFTVPLDGTAPSKLPIPHAERGAVSPDGATIAYNPLGDAFRQWKHYRGGRVSRIWLYATADHSVVQVPQPAERSNDVEAMWVGEALFFLSDRAGELNLFSYDPSSEAVEQRTHHDDYPVLHASAGPDAVVYEQAGYLHVYDPASGTAERLRIGVGADLVETRPRFVSGAEHVRSADLSPSGARAVFEYRGEILTVPAKKGDPRNLSASPGAHERSPVWSPDGDRIAYFSDASGEYGLVVAPQNGDGEAEIFPLDGHGFYDSLRWSPDGRKLSFSDNGWTLSWLDLETGERHVVATEPVYGPIKTQHHAWSPDSRWLAYTKITPTYFQRVFLHDLETGASTAITDGLSDVGEPVFDASGRYLWFTASTDAGPVRSWFAMSNADAELTNTLYVAVLARGEGSPFAPESDEEAGGGSADDKSETADEGDEDDDRVRIDFDGLDQRIVAVPVEEAAYSSLTPGTSGQLFYLKGEGSQPFGGGPAALVRFDVASREETVLLDGATGFVLSGDGKKVLVSAGAGWLLADAGGPIDRGKSRLDLDGVAVRIEPRGEWPQIFDEAWRINRDFFYDPGMHGADWPAMRDKYSIFLPHLASRRDLNRVIRWMCSELAVGHHRVGGGDRRHRAERVPGGLLGADFAIDNGRYRFDRIFGGLNWNPDLRSPLTEPGVEVMEGEYLLAVDGVELRAPENLYRRFERTAGRAIELTVGPDPEGDGSRTVTVVPIENEGRLRNRAWVEGNLAKVHEATDGRVAYVYVPNTTTAGHTAFKRYFFPQAGKDAIIVDERHNGGGQVADYYIDILRRPPISWWAMRYGADVPTPLASIQGPKVMLIDETAGSGGDLLPWMFRKLEIGPLIGRPTWGGLVGVLGFPVLMDGGGVTAPNVAIWTEDGFVVENVGVPPDIEVEQWPADLIAGRDPQLEKAIEVVLEMLEANPPEKPTRPPFPLRARP